MCTCHHTLGCVGATVKVKEIVARGERHRGREAQPRLVPRHAEEYPAASSALRSEEQV